VPILHFSASLVQIHELFWFRHSGRRLAWRCPLAALSAVTGRDGPSPKFHCLRLRQDIAAVAHLTFAEWIHELSPDQLHVAAERQRRAAEMVGSDASFHADQANRHVGQTLLDVSVGALLAQDNGPTSIKAKEVEAVPADVDAMDGS